MKFSQFRDAVAIAERGSLRAAARFLHVAQPALTRSVRELERELGATIFERRASGMVPTPAGEAFVRRAKVVLSEARRAKEEVEQLEGGTQGRVVVGLSIAAHLALLPGTLRPFHRRFQNVRLHLIEGFYPTLEAGLRSGNVDFYVGPRSDRTLPPDLIEEALFDNRRTILGRRGHPLASAKSLKHLEDAQWATTSITLQAEEELGELFDHYGLKAPRLAMQAQSALTLIVALANTDLLAMVPEQWVDFEITSAALISISVKEALPAPTIVMVRRAGLPLTPAAQHLSDLLRRKIQIPLKPVSKVGVRNKPR